MDNLEYWKKLQENGYFEKHRCYPKMFLGEVDFSMITYITNKTIVEIGCGYGRETWWMSHNANLVYAIDVSDTILNKTKLTVKKYGYINKVKFILAEKVTKQIKEADYIYSRHVFQHLPREMIQSYIEWSYNILSKNGIVDFLFRLGTKKEPKAHPEPLFEYDELEIHEMLKQFKIEKVEVETKAIRVIARKV